MTRADKLNKIQWIITNLTNDFYDDEVRRVKSLTEEVLALSDEDFNKYYSKYCAMYCIPKKLPKEAVIHFYGN